MIKDRKLNIVLELLVGQKDDGSPIVKKSTISNLRPDLTSEEIKEIVRTFDGLIKYDIYNAYTVSTQLVFS